MVRRLFAGGIGFEPSVPPVTDGAFEAAPFGSWKFEPAAKPPRDLLRIQRRIKACPRATALSPSSGISR
jgi:hypothetical protein